MYFSGCVIAELFTEGIPLFDLSQLLAYRKGQFQTEVLMKIEDKSIRDLVFKHVYLHKMILVWIIQTFNADSVNVTIKGS